MITGVSLDRLAEGTDSKREMQLWVTSLPHVFKPRMATPGPRERAC